MPRLRDCPSSDLGRLRTLGGHIALDFVNTVDHRGTEREIDFLADWPLLLAWALRSGLINRSERNRRIVERDDRALATLERAHRLRAALRRIFNSIVKRAPVRASDLVELNHVLAAGSSSWSLRRAAGRLRYGPCDGPEPSLYPLVLVADAAARLLASPDVQLIRICAAQNCGWFFLDVSPSRRRRWCSMEGCGNREKNQRFHQRRLKTVRK